jgi:hypothetical protein
LQPGFVADDTTKALGLALPPSLLACADEVSNKTPFAAQHMSLMADIVAKVFLHCGSEFLRAAGATFV